MHSNPPLDLKPAQPAPGLVVAAPVFGRHAEVLTSEALAFVAGLCRAFEPRRRAILARRTERQRAYDAGALPDFAATTASLRSGDWRVPPPPPDLVDRRIEVTGPVDRETVRAALASGAQGFMADLEDFTSPTWENLLNAQVNLLDAVRGRLDPELPATSAASAASDTATGGVYAQPRPRVTLHVRPRGWHLSEKHLLLDGDRVSAALFDFGLAFFHNAFVLRERDSGPYFYLPKLEGAEEARLWHDVFVHAERELGLPPGTIRATAMIETLPSVFEAEEILHALGVYALGLNCGRWDYLFSSIKVLACHPCLYPDRASLGMTAPFLAAYCRHVVRVCHRRGAYAIGGMAAQRPIPGDREAHEAALEKVRQDKGREGERGFDGACVGDPALVSLAREALTASFSGAHQLGTMPGVEVSSEELLAFPQGPITEDGVRINLRVGVRYLEAWLRGQGCVVLDHQTEDLATAEIARALLWQWRTCGARLEDGRPVTDDLYDRLLAEEIESIQEEIGSQRFRSGPFPPAIELFLHQVKAPTLAEFLTLDAYEILP